VGPVHLKNERSNATIFWQTYPKKSEALTIGGISGTRIRIEQSLFFQQQPVKFLDGISAAPFKPSTPVLWRAIQNREDCRFANDLARRSPPPHASLHPGSKRFAMDRESPTGRKLPVPEESRDTAGLFAKGPRRPGRVLESDDGGTINPAIMTNSCSLYALHRSRQRA
jgi:hypothetical protein